MPPVLSSVEVQAFRSLKGLKLEGLGRANVLLGVNDSGKTSVLEALLLLTDPTNPALWGRLAHLREPSPMPLRRLSRTERVQWLFPAEAEGEPGSIQVSGKLQNQHPDLFGDRVTAIEATYVRVSGLRPDPVQQLRGGSSGEVLTHGAELLVVVHGPGARANKLTMWDRETIRATPEDRSFARAELVMAYQHWLSSSAERFSRARLENTTDDLLGLLRLLDDNIRGLELLQPEGEATLYIEHAANGLVPLSVFGDGVRRALLLAEAVVRARGGLLLVDEIETGIHVDAITGVFTWLLRACRAYDVQLFVTTHSIEAVDAILKADETPEEDVIGYRLERENGLTTAKRFGENQLRWMREERGLDVRK